MLAEGIKELLLFEGLLFFLVLAFFVLTSH